MAANKMTGLELFQFVALTALQARAEVRNPDRAQPELAAEAPKPLL